MKITQEHNITTEGLSDSELNNLVNEARIWIWVLYEKEKLGDPDVDLKLYGGGCGVFALLLYNLFPNESMIYISDNHAVTKIRENVYDSESTKAADIITNKNNNEYFKCDFNNNGENYFYQFLDRCKIQNIDRPEYDKILNDIKEKLNMQYDKPSARKLKK